MKVIHHSKRCDLTAAGGSQDPKNASVMLLWLQLVACCSWCYAENWMSSSSLQCIFSGNLFTSAYFRNCCSSLLILRVLVLVALIPTERWLAVAFYFLRGAFSNHKQSGSTHGATESYRGIGTKPKVSALACAWTSSSSSLSCRLWGTGVANLSKCFNKSGAVSKRSLLKHHETSTSQAAHCTCWELPNQVGYTNEFQNSFFIGLSSLISTWAMQRLKTLRIKSTLSCENHLAPCAAEGRLCILQQPAWVKRLAFEPCLLFSNNMISYVLVSLWLFMFFCFRMFHTLSQFSWSSILTTNSVTTAAMPWLKF